LLRGYRSVAHQLNGIGPLPEPKEIPYAWPLVANAALAEVMRGLWGGRTDHATDNISDLDTLETNFASRYAAGVPPGLVRPSCDLGRAPWEARCSRRRWTMAATGRRTVEGNRRRRRLPQPAGGPEPCGAVDPLRILGPIGPGRL
jgi:hypothetical protein